MSLNVLIAVITLKRALKGWLPCKYFGHVLFVVEARVILWWCSAKPEVYKSSTPTHTISPRKIKCSKSAKRMGNVLPWPINLHDIFIFFIV